MSNLLYLPIGDWYNHDYIQSSDREHEEPDESRGSRPVLWEGRGEIPLPDPITALTELFLELKTDQTPAVVERIVTDIDGIVRVVRFPGWQNSISGEREVQSSLRKILWAKYKINDQVLFDRAYAYIKEYYQKIIQSKKNDIKLLIKNKFQPIQIFLPDGSPTSRWKQWQVLPRNFGPKSESAELKLAGFAPESVADFGAESWQALRRNNQ